MALKQTLISQGFVVLPTLIPVGCWLDINAHLRALSAHSVGTRNLLNLEWCVGLIDALRCHPDLAPLLPDPGRAVQCIFFTKSVTANWLVPFHQDLSIPVARRVAHPHVSGWSTKEGVHYVHPPLEILEKMVVVRLHLDDSDSSNGALWVIPCSHTKKRLDPAQISGLRVTQGEECCAVAARDGLVLSPLLLHRSSKSRSQRSRRVLHFLFGPPMLPYGLEWRWAI